MSRDMRKGYYNRDWERDRERDRDRDREYRRPLPPKRSHSPLVKEEKRRSRSPPRIKPDKDMLDENILSEISKLPEPSELWEPNQFQDTGFPPPPFPPPEPNPSYNNYPPPQPYSGIYDDFPPVSSIPPAPQAPDIGNWNQLSLPPPPTAPPQFNIEEQIKKEAAIESEMRHQKAALSKQREDYMKKAGILKKELETLKDQRNELRGDPKRSPSPDTKRFLKENTKLQLEIQNKLKTINNVVDMLNGIIGEEAAETLHDSDDSGEREKTSKRKSRSPTNKKFNYVYYDPEMHWCRVCNEFPSTAKDYLNHLHSPAHQKMAAAHMEAPWHSVTTVNEGFPSFAAAPTKRTPIRGLQFFVPSTAWYCKLCDQFIGDLHCASAHLKSVIHSKNYTNFVEQNPHWETDWMSDRQKAFEKARGNKAKEDPAKAAAAAAAAAAASRYAAHTITFNKDGFHTKRKDSPPPPAEEPKKKKKDKKEKKKKRSKSKRKKSSSSSSSSSTTSSDSDAAAKKKKKRQADARLNESDRQLLDSLKSRMTRDRDAARDARDARDARERAAFESRKRESERRSDRSRESSRMRSGSRERRPRSVSRARAARASPGRKPEIRKMPFIGKMPVYKNLTKTAKSEEQKKEDQKKKDDDESTKKRREEMDAEIQKKVAEFKDKIAKAQLAQELGPPAVALPTQLGAPVPFIPQPAAAAPPPQPPALLPTPSPSNLSKDFQDALDIIFPSEAKQAERAQQELFAALPFPPFGMPPFPLLQPGLMQPPQLPGMMMPFDMSQPSLLGPPPRPSLYDTHVPLVPSPKPRQNNKRQNNNKHKQNQNQKNQNQNQQNQNQQNQNQQNQNQQNQNQQNQNQQNQNQQNQSKPPEAPKPPDENGAVARKKEELDDLAMLGIDAGDVAGM